MIRKESREDKSCQCAYHDTVGCRVQVPVAVIRAHDEVLLWGLGLTGTCVKKKLYSTHLSPSPSELHGKCKKVAKVRDCLYL